jgi:DNA-binding IclR family transcriptional regulator
MAQGTIQVLDRAFDIIEALAQSNKPLHLSELGERTGMSKSTVHRILQSLQNRGYASQMQDGCYTVGSKLFETASCRIDSLELQAEAKPFLEILQKTLGVASYLGVLDGPFVSIIEQHAADRSEERYTKVGRRYPAHCTSMGKCLLACLSSDDLESVLYGFDLQALTPQTITDKRAFVQHLHQVRKQGWALDREESALNHRCLAAPVFDYRGDAVAVVGISGPNSAIPDERIEEMAHEVVRASQGISKQLGYSE